MRENGNAIWGLVVSFGIGVLFCTKIVLAAQKVHSLSIKGNKALSNSAIKMAMQTRGRPWYGRLPWIEGPVFDQGVFRKDIKRIERRYREEGYRSVQIDTALHQRGKGIDLKIHIREGPVTRIERMGLEGLPATVNQDSAGLLKKLASRAEHPLRQEDLTLDRERVRDWAAEPGLSLRYRVAASGRKQPTATGQCGLSHQTGAPGLFRRHLL